MLHNFFFVPAILTGTIDFYHVHKVSAIQNLLASFSPTLFICFIDCIEELKRRRAFGHLRLSLIQTWYNYRFYCTLHFVTSLIDVDLHSRSQECEKAKTSAPVISQSFQSFWMEFGILWRLVGVRSLIFSLFSIQGRKIYVHDFPGEKKLPFACIQTFTEWFLSNLVWW